MTQQARAGSIEEHEVVECDKWAAAAFSRDLVRSDAYPRHSPVDAMRRWLRTNPPDPDNSIELPGTHVTHAIVDAEPAIPVWITCMCALVDERSHTLPRAIRAGGLTRSSAAEARSASHQDGRRCLALARRETRRRSPRRLQCHVRHLPGRDCLHRSAAA